MYSIARRYTNPMIRLTVILAAFLSSGFSCLSAELTPLQTAESLFAIMLKHDAEAGKMLFTPEATMTAVHNDGQSTVVPADKWLARIGTSKDTLLERMWQPQVLQHGSIAVVWGSYDFHLNDKFHHCGVDAFNLIKTQTGWKIAGVSYTSETTGCSRVLSDLRQPNRTMPHDDAVPAPCRRCVTLTGAVGAPASLVRQ